MWYIDSLFRCVFAQLFLECFDVLHLVAGLDALPVVPCSVLEEADVLNEFAFLFFVSKLPVSGLSFFSLLLLPIDDHFDLTL
jgi:hypothetical protein